MKPNCAKINLKTDANSFICNFDFNLIKKG